MQSLSPYLVLSRRRFLEGAVALSGALFLPAHSAFSADEKFALSKEARRAMAKSPLVYMTPIKSNGKESQCHSEIWFAHHESEIYLVTPDDAWRTQAIRKGLDRARIWVGDYGVWRNNDKFKTAPSYLAKARILKTGDPAIERCLGIMGKKYPSDWDKWGPRFRTGLNDGSRVVLRYKPVDS